MDMYGIFFLLNLSYVVYKVYLLLSHHLYVAMEFLITLRIHLIKPLKIDADVYHVCGTVSGTTHTRLHT